MPVRGAGHPGFSRDNRGDSCPFSRFPSDRAAAHRPAPDHCLHDDDRRRPRQGAPCWRRCGRSGAPCAERLRPEPARDLDRPRRRRRGGAAAASRSPPGTAATTASPGSAWPATASSTPPTRRASATARRASRSSSAPRPRASARPRTPTARSTTTARFPGRQPQPARPHAALARRLRRSEALALEGPCVTVSTACSSSAKVFAAAERMIRLGLVDAAIVGGVDTLCGSVLFGFNALQLVSPEPCRPFDADARRHQHRRGGRLRPARARRRDAATAACACSATASRATPTTCRRRIPKGLGAERALDDALARAGLDAERRRPHQPARHGERQERRGRGGAGRAPLSGAHARQLDQGLHRPHARRRRHRRGGGEPARDRDTASCPAPSTRATLDPACGPQIRLDAGRGRRARRRSATRSASAATTACWCSGRRRAMRPVGASRAGCRCYVEGIAFWAPTLPGWAVARAAFRGEGAPRRSAGRSARRPSCSPPAERRRAPDTRRARPRGRRAPRCATSGRDADDAAVDLHLGARRPRGQRLHVRDAGDASRRRSRRRASTTRCTTPPPATGRSAPAAAPRAPR